MGDVSPKQLSELSLGLSQQSTHQRDHLRAVKFNAVHELFVLHRTSRVFHLEARNTERADKLYNLLCDCFGGTRVKRAVLDLVFKIPFCNRRPAALPSETVADLLEMREEITARLLIAFGNVARRMHTDFTRLATRLFRRLAV